MIKLEWRPVALGDGPAISTSITSAETRALERLADGRDVLEVGSAYGYSAVAMALAGGTVTAVDPHEWLGSLSQMNENLRAYGVMGLVEVYLAASYVALPTFVAEGRTFGLIFIDGDHAEQAVTHDVGWAVKLLADGGVLACHDYDEVTCPGVRAALDRLLGPPPELVDTLAVYEGLT